MTTAARGPETRGVPARHYGASVGFAPVALARVRLEAGVAGASTYFADDANTVGVAGYSLLSLTAALTEPLPVGARLAMRGFASVSNLANRRYIASAFLNPDVVNGVPVAFEPGPGREFVVGWTLETR